MTTNRLEAFSDGVMAIIITIFVLEMEVPEGADLESLQHVLPTFLTYVLSFVYIGIYWNNHHHLWQAVEKVSGKVLWANLHLLFWLSLLPFATGWMGQNHFTEIPVALYGVVLLMASVAWYILGQKVVKNEGIESKVGKAYQKDRKTKLSILIYTVAVAIAFFQPIVSCAMYILLAAAWFIPDRRIEKALEN
ncbi:TMEM175 family protein [Roseivirga sp.]|uniref:TMEM175 family protein n=1 Tax=Roseivirga sp. TaxID=1964215 RepID=UPI002B268D5C|nr:TMEM175 family protein [Roseivirga sp.]